MRTPTDETTLLRTRPRSFIAYCLERSTLQLAIKVTLIVGTILGIINHGQAILIGHFTTDRLIALLLTYLVPFSVSMYSQVQAKIQRDALTS